MSRLGGREAGKGPCGESAGACSGSLAARAPGPNAAAALASGLFQPPGAIVGAQRLKMADQVRRHHSAAGQGAGVPLAACSVFLVACAAGWAARRPTCCPPHMLPRRRPRGRSSGSCLCSAGEHAAPASPGVGAWAGGALGDWRPAQRGMPAPWAGPGACQAPRALQRGCEHCGTQRTRLAEPPRRRCRAAAAPPPPPLPQLQQDGQEDCGQGRPAVVQERGPGLPHSQGGH